MDEDDLTRAKKSLGDGQRTDLIVCYDPTRVADNVCITLPQAKDLVHIETRVHAGDHRNTPGRGQRQIPLLERVGVGCVILEQLLCYAHRFFPSLTSTSFVGIRACVKNPFNRAAEAGGVAAPLGKRSALRRGPPETSGSGKSALRRWHTCRCALGDAPGQLVVVVLCCGGVIADSI